MQRPDIENFLCECSNVDNIQMSKKFYVKCYFWRINQSVENSYKYWVIGGQLTEVTRTKI